MNPLQDLTNKLSPMVVEILTGALPLEYKDDVDAIRDLILDALVPARVALPDRPAHETKP